ncbi:TetR/AcrR family transcriptional regulator [Staphylococcus equorum]|uniref:TetR/AcrR family transcriptional regulator n=1 Tax=Staphylococcus equorum TaxID=246432 RepID=A0A9X4LG37_9STAP|nr:TetR/AcrR family transcriptional regulator [Staphylococcus equorum]MDG0842915.1 TetR/AcrR family transcriptional regulator [Staphylococcus equorum]MDG0859463.1 TetR/AcrR family transcriptional regulator [Staphylococcus equorum]
MNQINKKQELLSLAAKIIQEDGMHKLTMDYLAKKANITKGGVLYHFNNKETLIKKMNEMVIEEFETAIEYHISMLSGSYKFTRAYALATLDCLRESNNTQLTAVLISSREDKNSLKLWKDVTQTWQERFALDEGNPDEILKLRLISDGLWFSIMYEYLDMEQMQQMERIVFEICNSLNQENK